MSAKIVFLFAQALLIQSAFSQSICRSRLPLTSGIASPYGLPASSLAVPGLAAPCWAGNGLAPAIEIAPTSGGALPVTSASAIAPNSVVVESENVYEGTLAVAGELPFVGTVGLEGVMPSTGAGAVNHACGNGMTRMLSQNAGPVSPAAISAMAPGFGAGFGPAVGIGAFGNAGAIAPATLSPALASPFGLSAYDGLAYPGAGLAPYGGAGEGNVAVAGELPVAGTTAVAGQVPIMGAVNFGGAVPAAGAVSISGNCACGCGSPYLY